MLLRRLEDAGFAVEPVEPGCVYFETRGIERLAGGLQEALARALDAAGAEWEPRSGAALAPLRRPRRRERRAGGPAVVVDDGETALFLEPLPVDLLALTPERRDELSELGVQRLRELAALPGSSVADRLGPVGVDAWRRARGEDDGAVRRA